MSKASSGLFQGTIGHKNKSNVKTGKSNATQNRRHVLLWAQEKVKGLANISNRQREKFNTASVAYDESTGKYYYGRNNVIEKNGTDKNPILFGDNTHEGILPKHSLNDYKVGNCAEVDAINKALNDGAKLENLHLTTIYTTSSNMGKKKTACKNCTYSFKGKVKRNYTGWYKED